MSIKVEEYQQPRIEEKPKEKSEEEGSKEEGVEVGIDQTKEKELYDLLLDELGILETLQKAKEVGLIDEELPVDALRFIVSKYSLGLKKDRYGGHVLSLESRWSEENFAEFLREYGKGEAKDWAKELEPSDLLDVIDIRAFYKGLSEEKEISYYNLYYTCSLIFEDLRDRLVSLTLLKIAKDLNPNTRIFSESSLLSFEVLRRTCQYTGASIKEVLPVAKKLAKLAEYL